MLLKSAPQFGIGASCWGFSGKVLLHWHSEMVHGVLTLVDD